MGNRNPATARFWLNAAVVSARLEDRQMNQGDLADEIGQSRSYWSKLMHRRWPLTPRLRRWLLSAPTLAGLGEAQL